MDLARILSQNISAGSGNHGLNADQLYQVFGSCKNLEQLAYTLRKCVEHSGKEAFTTQPLTIVEPALTDFTEWHWIDEPWSPSWGFDKTQPGCYIYGHYTTKPTGPGDFLDSGVIYIGESRAVTRNCMLGRRTDFKGTVKNNRLSPYGCGTAFKEAFGADQIVNTYQSYLPMHPSLCKQTELKLLSEYYKKYNRMPVCNPPLDLVRVQKFIKTTINTSV